MTRAPKINIVEDDIYQPEIIATSSPISSSSGPTVRRNGNTGSMAKQRFIQRIMFIVLIIAIGFSSYFYYKLHKLQQNTNTAAQKEAKDLLSQVAKIYLIPTGEEPTVATVSDPLKLKDQAFFANAQKDDKVLMFSTAGKAVLYRPSINKIIETAPFNINKNTNATPTPQPEKSSTPLKDKTF